MKRLKQLWLNAYEQTLDEYVKETHKVSTTKCAKCKVSGRNETTSHYNCSLCPESVHEKQRGFIACLKRNASPADSHRLTEVSRGILIQYHEEAVKYLNSVENFDMDEFKEELLRIDKQFETNE